MKCISITKRYGGKTVLSSFSATFTEGRTTLVMGRSGVGKTTLLRVLSGLEEYEGSIEDEPKVPVVLFQEDRLIENMSVSGNLRAVSDDRAKAEGILSELGLLSDKDKKVRELSGGMKRRVAIARMLLMDGDLYLLDEPFTGLDDDTKEKTAETIRKRLEGKTLIVVTHDREDGVLLGAVETVDMGGNDGQH